MINPIGSKSHSSFPLCDHLSSFFGCYSQSLEEPFQTPQHNLKRNQSKISYSPSKSDKISLSGLKTRARRSTNAHSRMSFTSDDRLCPEKNLHSQVNRGAVPNPEAITYSTQQHSNKKFGWKVY